MTTVNIDMTDPVTGQAPSGIRMVFTATRRLASVGVVQPQRVNLTNGIGTVDLLATDNTAYGPEPWAWRVDEYWPGRDGVHRYVLVPTSGTALQYDALVEVNGDSLAPDATPEDAWWVALGNVTGGSTPSGATPQPVGTAAVGTATAYARGDHAHALGDGVVTLAKLASDVTSALAAKADQTAVDTALAAKAPLASPALTGSPTVGGQAIVVDNDSRLTNARTPTAHASSHGSAGSDPVSLNGSQITAGTVAYARLPVGTTTSTVAAGDDSRLSNARTPTAHASSHASAGSDPITIAESQVTNLVTDLAGKAAATHTHAESDVTNLTTDLAGKAAATHTHAESDVTSLTTDLAAKAPAASPTLTGTVTVSGRAVVTPDSLTDAATIATDASAGNHFRVTLTASGHVLGNPTNLSDGQRILFEIAQDATGSRAYTLGTKFHDPNGYFTGQSTAANKRDYLGVVYRSSTDTLDVLAFSAGY